MTNFDAPTWSLLALALAAAPASAGSLEELDALPGWEDHGWGSAPTTDLVAIGREDDWFLYRPGDGPWSFLDTPVQSLVLAYRDDQLVAFRFEVERGIAKLFTKAYGPDSRSGLGERFWIGKRVKLEVRGTSATFTSTEALGTGTSLATTLGRTATTEAAKGTLAWLDTRPGFRDLAWGSGPLEGMQLVDGAPGGEAYYLRPDDKLAAGAYPLASIVYGYWRDQLFTVMLITPDHESTRGVLAGLEEAYGPATATDDGRTVWHGDRVELSLARSADSDQAGVVYFYKPIREALAAEEEAAAKQAADDL